MNKRQLFLSSLLASTLAVSTLAFAGPNGDYCGKHGKGTADKTAFMEKRLDRMSEKLELTADQKAKMKAVMESKPDFKTQKEALRKEFKALDPTSASYETELKALAVKKAALVEQSTIARGMKRKQVAGILTAEQRKKMEEMKGKHHKRGHHRGHGGYH